VDKQTIRFILIALVAFSGFSLFSKYQQQSRVEAEIRAEQTQDPELEPILQQPTTDGLIKSTAVLPGANQKISAQEVVTVDTDVLKVKINSNGDLVFAELKKYPQEVKEYAGGFNLLEHSKQRFYVAQTGLLSEIGPDSKVAGRAKFVAHQRHYELGVGQSGFNVDLVFSPEEGPLKNIKFIKRFVFNKSSYLITIEYIVVNNSTEEYKASLYGRLRRLPDVNKQGFFSGGLRTYTGAAISTPNERYKKIAFSDMKTPYKIAFSGGWVAMLEHYFVSAFIPAQDVLSEYQTEDFKDGSFGIRFVNSTFDVMPGETKNISTQLFVGPKIAETLKQVAPALDLTVDYGMLWWLSVPLFWLLKNIFSFIGNWGWSIIFTTLFIKILFYKLSATSYRSMGNLRKLQPKIEDLKARHGEDRQKFSQSVMELYRSEKVNPLGGCLPILVQIPVFIALYYVLLESVELRQASWCLWVTDLSAKDPFYILPVVMGLSMFFQQKMNPPPPDPVQAKVLMFMPVFFTVLFLQFPSGLMLYWIVNNSLSILQQLFIEKYVVKKA
jgi:YidC/Oxa1 family membrane protein insertase